MARVSLKATPEVVSRPHLGTDLTVGLLMLALDARYLKNRVMALRRHEPLRKMVPRALALIVAEPGGVCEDIGVVVDHLVTSPLLVLHWPEHKSNRRGASPPRLNHGLHAIDAMPAR